MRRAPKKSVDAGGEKNTQKLYDGNGIERRRIVMTFLFFPPRTRSNRMAKKINKYTFDPRRRRKTELRHRTRTWIFSVLLLSTNADGSHVVFVQTAGENVEKRARSTDARKENLSSSISLVLRVRRKNKTRYVQRWYLRFVTECWILKRKIRVFFFLHEGYRHSSIIRFCTCCWE